MPKERSGRVQSILLGIAQATSTFFSAENMVGGDTGMGLPRRTPCGHEAEPPQLFSAENKMVTFR